MNIALPFLIICIATVLKSNGLPDLPTFYLDSRVESILIGDRLSCFHEMENRNARSEIGFLQQNSATEYFRSHELFAHHYFVEMGTKNAQRRYKYSEAELEYIPLLPLHWTTKSADPRCSYKSLVASILKAQEYLEQRDGRLIAAEGAQIRPKFTVSSTFNLRTELGTGMPTQVRKGAAWDSVTRFVTSLTVGHYERWPQCPDLLRKSPRLNVELPYVTTSSDSVVTKGEADVMAQSAGGNIVAERSKMFFFSGNFALFGPEMVCSVRNAILSIASSSRADAVVLNSTAADANGPLRLQRIAYHASRSVFCLVAKGDSYSTSFFYLALRHGCIPVVVSDWFVFAFPWAVPYERFVLRVREEDFLLNPAFVLDYLRDNIAAKPGLLHQMRSAMRRYAPLLSFDRVKTGSLYHRSLLMHDKYIAAAATAGPESTASASASASASAHMPPLPLGGGDRHPYAESQQPYSYLPLELLLLEVRYSQQPHRFYNSIPCLRPYMCSDTHLPGRMYDPAAAEYTFPAKSKVRSLEVTYTETALDIVTPGASEGPVRVGYSTVNDGYQVKGLFLPQYEDLRPHLCRHASRLIGSYKVVFFMQCVRILWPLQPGAFKPVDNVQRFLPGFDNKTQVIARYRGGRYPVDPEGISEVDMRFVSAFHNATKPAGWVLTNYPVNMNVSSRIALFS